MLLRITADAPEPIYEQIVRQVHAALASGRLSPGEQVPSHRDLATRLAINHLTVKRAYEQLERDGLLQTRRGLGTFVVERVSQKAASRGHDILASDLSRIAAAARELGYDRETWKQACTEAWKDKA
jgi:GntR family transcriptional regulator